VPINVRRPPKTRITGVTSAFLVLFTLSACSDVQDGSGAGLPSASVSAPVPSEAQPALTQAIQGIDAAIYGYGVIGAYLGRSDQKKAKQAIATLNRERLTFELVLGRQINEIAVAYELPNPVTDATSAKALAELLEMRLIPLFSDVATSATGITKTAAEVASAKATRRAAGWLPNPAPKSTP
jgi:hypothetical protein